MEKLEAGLHAAQVKLKESKAVLEEKESRKWRAYLFGALAAAAKKEPDLQKLHDTKLSTQFPK